MGVGIPGFHLRSKKDLPETRKRLKGSLQRKKYVSELNLTSLIDIMSMIIFFLLNTFSATGEIMTINKDIKLPTASYGKMLERSPIVTVTEDNVSLEGSAVGSNIDIEREDFAWDLPLLARKLRQYRAQYEDIHEGAKYSPDIILQADREIDFVYIKRVMFTLLNEGFYNINLVVAGKPFDPAN